jgi:hypothetical protein
MGCSIFGHDAGKTAQWQVRLGIEHISAMRRLAFAGFATNKRPVLYHSGCVLAHHPFDIGTDMPPIDPHDAPHTVLWLGLDAISADIRPIFSKNAAHISANLAEIDAAYLAMHRPNWVICPLFPLGAQHRVDAFGVLDHLRIQGFSGLVYVLAPPLPHPQMIEQELAQPAGNITVRLIVGGLAERS